MSTFNEFDYYELEESHWEPDPFEDWEYDLFLPRLKRELKKQVVAPRNVLRLRLYLYSNIDGHPPRKVELFWIKFDALLQAAVEEGEVVAFPQDYHWYLSPDSLDQATELYPRKKEVYENWMGSTGSAGYHLDDLVRQALRRAGYTVADRAVAFRWNNDSIELDAFASSPLQLGIQAKNKFSETYHHPDVSKYMTDDLRQIKKTFDFCSAKGIIPVLVASLVDRTFYSFQHDYKGLHCCLKFQFFRGAKRNLCETVRRVFLIGNIQAWDEPPPWMQRWFDTIPQHYRNRYKTDPPWVAA